MLCDGASKSAICDVLRLKRGAVLRSPTGFLLL
jgi:hypothetical protein